MGRPVLVCFVNYPGPVVYAASDSTVMIGVKSWDVDGAELERMVEAAMREGLGLSRV